MREAASAAVLGVLAGPASAAEISTFIPNPFPITPHEAFLAAGIGAMIACGMTSFFLDGRVTERTHVALAMLVMLISGFCLFGLVGREIPVVGCLVLLGLIGLFKLMSQFEVRRKRSPSDK
jgi:ABC-type thiamin/hydroxymethylpyrimidine transport system permease subunit